MRICISAILLALLTACSTTAKLKKAKKLIAEAEAQGVRVTVDTVYKDKVVKVKGDSTFVMIPIHHYHDTTIFVTKDRIKIKEVFKHDTVWHFIKCPDTVLKTKQATAINQTIDCPPQSDFWKWVALTVSAVLAFTIYLIVKKI